MHYPDRPLTGPAGTLERLGLGALALADCLWLYLRILGGRARLDLPAFATALRQSGLSVLPALTLVSIALGLILGRQGELLLAGFALPDALLISLTYAIALEVIPVLIGILVAGRAGVALAVRQAGLAVSGELDGLLVNGIDPIRFTLAPTLLAMLLMSTAFAVWTLLVTGLTTGAWLWASVALSPARLVETLAHGIGPADLIGALIKPPLFALLVAPLACVNGIAAGRDPRGIARAATATMLGAIGLILVVDLLYLLLIG
ncbi:MlaE family ABC transporter permease [Marichromatium bheemlicum]|uniref:ABC transporter permease n=1 Tax=Marichromatium bheemlicum TaxID=365339 RepID=A0ABX1IE39_9GAMM|nr:ABC transporter permease [Marichromatium bheemlicum]NKN34585.1 ABC transporter permease [Marichromatium bheemlicum]